jgi:hypothetical protein
MTALRQEAHQVLDLIPEEDIEQVLSIIVTFKNKEKPMNYDSVYSAGGMLQQYADTTKWGMEEGAFEEAMVNKHAIN